MIHRLPTKINQNKPIYTGFSILELSKAHMYRFHYDVVLAKYGLDCRLLFTDTDSFCYHIKTDDVYRDMQTFSDDLDTSSYPTDSARDALKTLYSWKNAKVLGGNSKTNVTALPPWSSWDCVPKCTRCWCRDCRQKLPQKESKSHSSKST